MQFFLNIEGVRIIMRVCYAFFVQQQMLVKNLNFMIFQTFEKIHNWDFYQRRIFLQNHISLASKATLIHESSLKDVKTQIFWK